MAAGQLSTGNGVFNSNFDGADALANSGDQTVLVNSSHILIGGLIGDGQILGHSINVCIQGIVDQGSAGNRLSGLLLVQDIISDLDGSSLQHGSDVCGAVDNSLAAFHDGVGIGTQGQLPFAQVHLEPVSGAVPVGQVKHLNVQSDFLALAGSQLNLLESSQLLVGTVVVCRIGADCIHLQNVSSSVVASILDGNSNLDDIIAGSFCLVHLEIGVLEGGVGQTMTECVVIVAGEVHIGTAIVAVASSVGIENGVIMLQISQLGFVGVPGGVQTAGGAHFAKDHIGQSSTLLLTQVGSPHQSVSIVRKVHVHDGLGVHCNNQVLSSIYQLQFSLAAGQQQVVTVVAFASVSAAGQGHDTGGGDVNGQGAGISAQHIPGLAALTVIGHCNHAAGLNQSSNRDCNVSAVFFIVGSNGSLNAFHEGDVNAVLNSPAFAGLVVGVQQALNVLTDNQDGVVIANVGRQNAIVLQHNDGFVSNILSQILMLVDEVSNGLIALGVVINEIKLAGGETGSQNIQQSCIQVGLLDHAQLNSLSQALLVVVASCGMQVQADAGANSNRGAGDLIGNVQILQTVPGVLSTVQNGELFTVATLLDVIAGGTVVGVVELNTGVVGNDPALEAPGQTQDVGQQIVVAMAGNAVDGAVSSHNAGGIAFLNHNIEMTQVVLTQLLLAHVGGAIVTGSLCIVGCKVLDTSDSLQVIALIIQIALEALNEGSGHCAGQQTVFSKAVTGTAPAGITGQVDTGTPVGQALLGGVVECPGLIADGICHLANQIRIPGCTLCQGRGEGGSRRLGVTGIAAVPPCQVGNTVQVLTGIPVLSNAKTLDGGTGMGTQLRSLFCQGHVRNQVSSTFFIRKAGIPVVVTQDSFVGHFRNRNLCVSDRGHQRDSHCKNNSQAQCPLE